MTEEQKASKDRLNCIYQDLIVAHKSQEEGSIQSQFLKLFEAMLGNVIGNPTVLSTVWKASVKTMIKLLSYSVIIESLRGYDFDALAKVFIEANIDTVDHSEQEQTLLLKQKMLLKIVKTFAITDESILSIVKYVNSVIKKWTIEDIDSYYTL